MSPKTKKNYPTQAESLSSIQEAVISLTRIVLPDHLIKSLNDVDHEIHSILDCAWLDLINEQK